MTAQLSDLHAQLLILERICIRGRSMFLDREDSLGVDMFEHMETELGRLAYMIGDLDVPVPKG